MTHQLPLTPPFPHLPPPLGYMGWQALPPKCPLQAFSNDFLGRAAPFGDDTIRRKKTTSNQTRSGAHLCSFVFFLPTVLRTLHGVPRETWPATSDWGHMPGADNCYVQKRPPGNRPGNRSRVTSRQRPLLWNTRTPRNAVQKLFWGRPVDYRIPSMGTLINRQNHPFSAGQPGSRKQPSSGVGWGKRRNEETSKTLKTNFWDP